MFKFISFFFFAVIFAGCQSTDFLVKAGELVLEKQGKELFGADFALGKDSIYFSKTLPVAKVCKVLSNDFCEKLTTKGSVTLDNNKVTTYLRWELVHKDSTKIDYYRFKK